MGEGDCGGLAAGELGFVAEFEEAGEETVAHIALEDEGAAVAGAAGAAMLFEGLKESVEFGVGAGEAGDCGGRLAASATLVALDADDAVVGDCGLRGRRVWTPAAGGRRRRVLDAALVRGVDEAGVGIAGVHAVSVEEDGFEYEYPAPRIVAAIRTGGRQWKSLRDERRS